MYQIGQKLAWRELIEEEEVIDIRTERIKPKI